MQSSKQPANLRRFLFLPLLSFYCLLLLTGAWPEQFSPAPTHLISGTSRALLDTLGIVPGLEVFRGTGGARDAPQNACFQVVGSGGAKPVVLYDDLWMCEPNRSLALEDVFFRDLLVVHQRKKLSAALVHLDLGGQPDLRFPPLHQLFLYSEYYCRLPAARSANVTRVQISSVFLTRNHDTGNKGRHLMGGRRDCASSTWQVL